MNETTPRALMHTDTHVTDILQYFCVDFNLDLDLVLDLNLKQRRTLTSNFASTPINGLHPVGILILQYLIY